MLARMKFFNRQGSTLLSLALCFALLIAPWQGLMAQEPVNDVDHDVPLDLIEGDNSGGGEVSRDHAGEVIDQSAPEQAPVLANRTYLPVIQGGNDNVDATVEAAFTRQWVVGSCNVSSSRRGLWDDMPGAREGDESGLFWLQTTSSANEQCSFVSNIAFPGVSTTTFPTLGFRVAVNDGGIFRLSLYRFNNGVCNTLLITRATTAAQAHSGFLENLNSSLTTGFQVCRVEITLTDNPDSAANLRVSALISDIRIHNGSTVGWGESFTN